MEKLGEKLSSIWSGISTTAFEKVEELKNTKDSKTPAEIRLSRANNHYHASLCEYSIIEHNPEFKKLKGPVNEHLEGIPHKLDATQDKIVGACYAMNIGDALGSSFEFMHWIKDGYNKKGSKVNMSKDGFSGYERKHSNFNLKPGQWTDDAAMGLCLADSLIENEGFDGIQLMWAFQDWLDKGYNTAFQLEEKRGAVGLGGNISQAMYKFNKNRTETGEFATPAGDKFMSGNGSLMRNAASALIAKDLKEAETIAWKQSKVTHQGDEAAACCQLMSHLMYRAIYEGATKETLFKDIQNFTCDVPTVMDLAQSKDNAVNAQNGKPENWNWRDKDFSFNAERLKSQPGYIGSYAMDALAMALHCIYTTDTFEDAVLKAATRGG